MAMPTMTTETEMHTIDIRKEIEVAAPVEVTFEAVLEELGPGSELPDGTSMNMKLEPRPGGRWFRDLGNDSGHLWGHVQVIKPPTLLEICGPMFMSYPAVNFVQYRLTAKGAGTHLVVSHRAFGQIPETDREGVQEGWAHGLKRIQELAARRLKAREGR
jgi:uncharacterized protein YndB with AHSA1/START domain